ncbi:MAG: helix-turn-helix transcriptional regulator [Dehalococcoidia bacterium]
MQIQSSKVRILAVLKRCGPRGVDDLATELHLAPMTVRQHLTALERDEMVSVTEQRNGAGRPRHLFSLTDRGDSAFPRRYDRFAAMLLAEVQDLDAAIPVQSECTDRMGQILDRIARREALPHVERLSLLSVPARARAAAAVLHDIGGFAEAVETPSGIEIRDYNCVYRGLRPHETGSCAWHSRLVPLLMQGPVHDLPAGNDAGPCCRMLVPGDAPAVHRTNHKDEPHD